MGKRFERLSVSADLGVSSVKAALTQVHAKGNWDLCVPPSLKSEACLVLGHISGGSLVIEPTLQEGRTRAWYVDSGGKACGSFEP